MSSYHNSFSYLGKNSKDDFGLIICHFSDNADSGETDTFLSTEAVYSDSYDGTRQKFYGAKYDQVAAPQITVIKQDGTDLGIADNRKILKWLTGSRQSSWMDFYIGNEVKYRLLGRVKSVSQYKMDAKIVGLILTFESVSPYGYSSLQTVSQTLTGAETITIPCDTDDLYSYVYMNTTFKNTSGSSLKIVNNTTGDTTEVTNIVQNEEIKISDNMVITSDKPSKTFGNTFNFVFPKLVAGDNNFTITGNGSITFEYILPVKLGNIAIDLNAVTDPICDDEGNIQINTLPWSRVSETPTTLRGYGITDAYTKTEVDQKVANVTVNNVYTKNEVYNKTEIDTKLANFVSDDVYTKTEIDNNFYTQTYISNNFYTKTEVDALLAAVKVEIDENELNAMLAEVLV